MTSDFGRIDWGEFIADLPLSPQGPCSYFSDRPSRAQFFLGDDDIPADLQETALAAGVRRCGDTYYRMVCQSCNLCIPYRVPVPEFRPSRNQRRVLQRNREVACRVVEPHCTTTKREMYVRYQYEQHFRRPAFGEADENDKFDADESLATLEYQMYTNPSTTRELEMWLAGRLIGFGTMDIAAVSSSLVYFVFDPEYGKRSLGTLNILHSIAWAETQGLAYVYLGYYIPEHPKMAYKRRFRPAEMRCRETDEWLRDLPPLRDPADNDSKETP